MYTETMRSPITSYSGLIKGDPDDALFIVVNFCGFAALTCCYCCWSSHPSYGSSSARIAPMEPVDV